MLFLLQTLDEQLIALIAFLATGALLVAVVERKIRPSTVIFPLSALLYVIYHLYMGRWLFEHYTPGGLRTKDHPHDISDVLMLNPKRLVDALQIIFYNYRDLGLASAGLLMITLVGIYQAVVTRHGTVPQYLIYSGLISFPVLLTAVLIASHPPIYDLDILWDLFYLAAPIHIIFCAVPFSLYMARFKTDYWLIIMALIFVSICIYGVESMEERYQVSCEKTRTSINGYECGENPIF